ncbi:MAG: hypothetical protein EPO63_08085 [Candidatus Nitrosotenuis sp.]|nr:MAG: hypothetical protein EPO63_08085 [Candidatus Nitrosotenuis sp.]
MEPAGAGGAADRHRPALLRLHRRARLELRRKNFLNRLLPIFLTVLLAAGCSYRLAGQGSILPDTIKSVGIPVFENDVQQPNLDITVTHAVTETFLRDGRLAVVDGGADSLLQGTIKSYTLEPVAFDTLNRVTQYRVKLMVNVKFTDNTGKGIALERDLRVQWDYNVGTAITSAEAARNQAVLEAARYLGDRIAGMILDGF